MIALDNVVWAALTGPQAHLAEARGDARRFPADISPFVALPDSPGPAAWADLAELLGPRGVGAVFRADVPHLPDGWEGLERYPGVQMVADQQGDDDPARVATGVVRLERLGPADTPEMLDLVRRTEPGPFAVRTVELGRYLGVRVDGRLVAMAGERMRPAGFTEISAVCTDPDHRGRGLAASLVAAVADGIRARGERPMLHVLTSNLAAIRVYERLGFVPRVETTAVVVQAPGR